MKNKLIIKELIFRITFILVLFTGAMYFFDNLKPKKECSKKDVKTSKNKERKNKAIPKTDQKLRNVEKINAHIEAQEFLLSKINNRSKKEKKNLLQIIENKLLSIEQEAKNKSVNNLINQTKINELKNNLDSYRQILRKKGT